MGDSEGVERRCVQGAGCAEASRATGQRVNEWAWRTNVGVLADPDLTWDDFVDADGQGLGGHGQRRIEEDEGAGAGAGGGEGWSGVGIPVCSAIGWQV